MDLTAVAARISSNLVNTLDEDEMRAINDELLGAYGATAVDDVLRKHGLTYGDKPGKAKPLRYLKLRSVLRNAYLWYDDNRARVEKRKSVLPLDVAEVERVFGKFTEEPEQD